MKLRWTWVSINGKGHPEPEFDYTEADIRGWNRLGHSESWDDLKAIEQTKEDPSYGVFLAQYIVDDKP